MKREAKFVSPIIISFAAPITDWLGTKAEENPLPRGPPFNACNYSLIKATAQIF